MENQLVLVERQGYIAVVTLSRPGQRNALSSEMWRQIHEAMDGLRDSADIRCVVITGAGKVFSAGVDLAEANTWTDSNNYLKYAQIMKRCINSIVAFPAPVIAMINGHAIGLGCELAMACDLRISIPEARFAIPSARLGVTLDYEVTRRVVAVVGEGNAKELLLVGDTVSAERALTMGLLNGVVGADSLRNVCFSMADRICHNAPSAVRGNKLIINRIQEKGGAADAEIETAVLNSFDSNDFKEGVLAFLENREPHW